MNFTSIIDLGPFETYGCDVEVIYLPPDPDTGVQEDWDVHAHAPGPNAGDAAADPSA